MMVDDLHGEKNRRELRGVVEDLKTKLERCFPLHPVTIFNLTTDVQYTHRQQNSLAYFEAHY
jgi:hypothetical protein